MSTVVQTGRHWHGFSRITLLVIFGDSYSAVGYDSTSDPPPSVLHPLGVPFPGNTWNEPDLPNWVGFLITKYCHPPRFISDAPEQDGDYENSPLLVYNYAVGGDTVSGVRFQVQNRFGRDPPKVNPDESLFITWVGINDCAYSSEHQATMIKLFAVQEELYESGARNFLFIDVPPIHRSPAFPLSRQRSTNFDNWNSALLEAIQTFCNLHVDITAMLFSSSATFNALLDEPEAYGFEPSDIRKAWGSVWVDSLHPTSKVHDVIARNMADFLGEVRPGDDRISN